MMRSDPFREADRLVQQLINAQGGTERALAVPIDAYRRGDTFVVEVDLPGVEPDSIDLTVEKNVVTLRAERRGPWGQQIEPLVRERPHGSFSRQLFMGDNLDLDALAADYNAGVLRLSIPVHAAAKARRISVSNTETNRDGQGS
ncbi:MAG TPA: Hsp20/alpha crystallin family protein [Acidimicrobiales bacterium]|nr:Hsp20/alpha crystallin family protein [Acidimicrobiales bacterium]